MRVRRLVVAAAMGTIGLVAVRKLRARRRATNEGDVWDTPPPAAPVSTTTPPAAEAPPAPPAKPPAPETPVDDSAPPSGKIKGNIHSDGEKIYHLPGDPMYAETKAEQEFDTAEEAEAAGYRRVGSPRQQPPAEQ